MVSSFSGDSEMAALIEEHVPVARYVARNYAVTRRLHTTDPDLDSDALLALCQLAGEWDPDRCPFAVFVRMFLPRRMIDLLRERTGRAGEIGFWPRWRVAHPGDLDDGARYDGGNDETVGGDGPEPTLADPAVDVEFAQISAFDALDRVLADRSERERTIVRLRLLGLTLREVGDEMGISESRVCQLLVPLRAVVGRALGTITDR